MESCAGADHGAPCTVFCAPGFAPVSTNTENLIGASRLTCVNGRWEGARCVEAPCESMPPGLQHTINAKQCVGTLSRQSCKIQCAVGYFVTGHPLCVRGAWMIPSYARCRQAPCTDYPDVPNARDTSSCINTLSGETCNLQCKDGF